MRQLEIGVKGQWPFILNTNPKPPPLGNTMPYNCHIWQNRQHIQWSQTNPIQNTTSRRDYMCPTGKTTTSLGNMSEAGNKVGGWVTSREIKPGYTLLKYHFWTQWGCGLLFRRLRWHWQRLGGIHAGTLDTRPVESQVHHGKFTLH